MAKKLCNCPCNCPNLAKPNDDLQRDPVLGIEKIKAPNCGFDRYEPFFPFLPLAKTISYGFKLPTVGNKHPGGVNTQCPVSAASASTKVI